MVVGLKHPEFFTTLFNVDEVGDLLNRFHSFITSARL
jgi:hypothetical protein